MERVMISIDGSNLYNMLKAHGLKLSVNFGRFVDKLRGPLLVVSGRSPEPLDHQSGDESLIRKRRSLDLEGGGMCAPWQALMSS